MLTARPRSPAAKVTLPWGVALTAYTALGNMACSYACRCTTTLWTVDGGTQGQRHGFVLDGLRCRGCPSPVGPRAWSLVSR